MTGVRGLFAVILSLGMGAGLCVAQSGKPRLPAGSDPGGIAVAFIGGGVDYLRPQIAARLARDGEGELIGWDFVDGDRRPYATCAAPACSTEIASRLIEDRGPVRLVVLKVTGAKPQSLVEAVRMVARTPARIVLLAPDAGIDPAFVAEAAVRHPEQVFVVASGPPAGVPAAAPAPANVLRVGGGPLDAALAAGRAARELAADPALAAAEVVQRAGVR